MNDVQHLHAVGNDAIDNYVGRVLNYQLACTRDPSRASATRHDAQALGRVIGGARHTIGDIQTAIGFYVLGDLLQVSNCVSGPFDTHSEAFSLLKPPSNFLVVDNLAAIRGFNAGVHLSFEPLVVGDKIIDGFLQQFALFAMRALRQLFELGFELRRDMECHGT